MRHIPSCGHVVFSPTLRAFILSTPQVLLAAGLMVLVLELFTVPLVSKRLGVTASQRITSVAQVFVLFLFPLLGRLLGTGRLLIVGNVALHFAIYACFDAVGGRPDGDDRIR